MAAPDDWAVAASSLPLAFAQVREDPRLDLELARRMPEGATVVMIASGGDTVVCLGRLPLRIHAVDMNPVQLGLSRLKWRLAGEPAAESLLGHLPMAPAERMAALERLGFSDAFGPPEIVAEQGPDHAGRYEVAFAEIRRRLERSRGDLDDLLSSPSPLAVSPGLGTALDEAFREVMALPNLVCLFGQEATQNPRQPFAEHFIQRTREVIGRFPPATNPFLWQILAGRFPPGHRYDWLGSAAPTRAEAVWHHGKMADALDAMPAESADLVHLSNILDWLSPEQAGATLDSARRVLRPGGRVILRQLNSTLDIPRLDSGIRWDAELGRAMEARDRSYFYPMIHVGSRP